MRIEFKYDRFLEKSEITLDNNPIGSYSVFSRCDGVSFFEWFGELPEYCRKEANEPYSFVFFGSRMEALILEEVFQKDSLCKQFVFKEEMISLENRMEWAKDICRFIGKRIPLSLRLAGKNENKNSKIIQSYLQKFTDTDFSVSVDIYDPEIVLDSENKQLSLLSQLDHPAALVIPSTGKLSFQKKEGNCCVFSADMNKIDEFLNLWLEETTYIDYFKKIKAIPISHGNKELLKKQELITGYNPYVELMLSSQRIEMSETATWSVFRVPEDLACSVYTNDGNLIQLDGKRIKPKKEGIANLTVSSKRFPSVRNSKTIEIYKLYTVQSISLSLSANQILKNQEFEIYLKYFPSNAMNLKDATWTFSPTGIIKLISKNKKEARFKAINGGDCTVTVKIGKVSESIRVHITPLPEKVYFSQNDIKIKLGKNNYKLTARIDPVGSIGGQILFSYSNPSVAELNQVTSEVITKSEGICFVTASLLDTNGTVIHEDRCAIEVLPPKDIYTPMYWDVVILIALPILMIVGISEMIWIMGIIAIGATFYGIVKSNTGIQKCLYYFLVVLISLIMVSKLYR